MRRLGGVSALLATAMLVGCGGDGGAEPLVLTPDAEDAAGDSANEAATDTAPTDTGSSTGTDADAEVGPPPGPTYDLHEKDRTACGFAVGSKTTETVGPAVPHGDALPFEHVIVLMLENRSFDHHFSKLPEYGVKDVDVAAETDSNPDPITKTNIQRYHETRYCTEDTAHNWGPVHDQYDDGLMDGFVATSNPGGARAMGYMDQTDLPYYYWLAKNYAIGDRHFCSLLGPTWPNRFFFWGATSWGRTHTPDTPPLGKPKITNLLEDKGKTWKVYRDGLVSFPIVFGPTYAGNGLSTFADDVKADKLPSLTLIDPSFSGGKDGDQTDEHPPANVQKGEKLIKYVIDSLQANPAVWKKTVLFITHDEHGGFYDHVAPPAACEPDGDRPPDYKFDRLGFRVPMIVVSPFAKPGYVSHKVTDHTSITRFIENRWDLPAMTRRDANAWPMLDYFDFDKPPLVTPPTGAPSAEPSAAGLDWCKKNPAATGLPK